MTDRTRAEHRCPDCGWNTRVWVDAAPGPSDWACKVCDLQAEIDLINESRRRAFDAVKFYGDPENWFAIGVWLDPPCGPIGYDIDPTDIDPDMGRPTHGRYARAVLRGEHDYTPPLDQTDWEERYPG